MRPTLKANGILVSTSKTSELRDPTDFDDKCKRKGDLTATALFDDGQTILDVGIHHPTIDSSINTLSVPRPNGRILGLRSESTEPGCCGGSRP